MREASAVYQQLGMESRSILKSIQTEESKLMQSVHLTRSDRHYFRARFNYYRLSLLRLPPEERDILEPALGRFLARITALEEVGEPNEMGLTPFLEAVKPSDISKPVSPATTFQVPESPRLITPPTTTSDIQEVVSQLSLIKMALSGELNDSAKRILVEGVDRAIRILQK